MEYSCDFFLFEIGPVALEEMSFNVFFFYF